MKRCNIRCEPKAPSPHPAAERREEERDGAALSIGQRVPEAGGGRSGTLERVVRDEDQRERQDDKATQHQDGLKYVGPGDRQEAADDGIGGYGDER